MKFSKAFDKCPTRAIYRNIQFCLSLPVLRSQLFMHRASSLSSLLYCRKCKLLLFVTFCLWSPYVIGQTIYIFILFLLLSSSSFFSSPNLSSRRLDGCLPYFGTWCGPSVNLECRSETCCARLAGNTGRKKSPKIAISAPSHNFVGLYLRN